MQRGLPGASAQQLAVSVRKAGYVNWGNVVAYQRAIIVGQGQITRVKSNRAGICS